MKRRLLVKIPQTAFLLLLIFSVTQIAFSQNSKPFSINESPLPAPTGFVNDYANVIDPATEQRIEQQISDFKKATNPSVEIAVAVVRTTEGRSIFEYSLGVARGWGIGSKEDDNPGALLFVAVDDRKYFTQVSRDLEDELPDGLVGSLQRQYLVPQFKKGNYSKGIEDTIDAYIRTIKQKQSGEPVAEDTSEPIGTSSDYDGRSSSGGSICNTLICLIILFVILFIIFSQGGGGSNNRRGGGGGGSGMGNALLWAVLSGIANSGSSSSSSGGWSSGGGSSGGWGGFGGGGDFGGGGAGGSW